MSKFILCCPNCGETEGLKHRGSDFSCTYCDGEFEWAEMDFEIED